LPFSAAPFSLDDLAVLKALPLTHPLDVRPVHTPDPAGKVLHRLGVDFVTRSGTVACDIYCLWFPMSCWVVLCVVPFAVDKVLPND
jgi:hypothetical protein